MSSPSSVRAPLDANQRLLAIGLVLGVTLVAFESTAVITALPTITDELGGDSLYGVALASYTLADLVALVAAGHAGRPHRARASRSCSPSRPSSSGLMVAGTADSMVVVVLGRTLQGAGTGGFAPLAYVLVKRAFPDDRQPTMYACCRPGWVLPSLIAPAFAGRRHRARSAGSGCSSASSRSPSSVGRDRQPADARLRPERRRRAGVAASPARTRSAQRAAWARWSSVCRPTIVAVDRSASVGGVALAVPMMRRLLPAGFCSRATAACPRCWRAACWRRRRSWASTASCRWPPTASTVRRAVVQGFVIVGAALAWTGGQAIMSRRTARRRRARRCAWASCC